MNLREFTKGLKNTNTEIKKSETQNSIKNFAPHPQKKKKKMNNSIHQYRRIF